MHRIYTNSVKSISKAPLIVIFIAEEQSGWCEQLTEEGYDVFQIIYPYTNLAPVGESIIAAGIHIRGRDGSWALVTYGLLRDDVLSVARLVKDADVPTPKACVHYAPLLEDSTSLLSRDGTGRYTSTMVHLSSAQEQLHASLELLTTSDSLGYSLSSAEYPPISVFAYPKVPSTPPFPYKSQAPATVRAGQAPVPIDPYIRSATSLAYSRTLDLLRRQLGPRFDLEKLWERHTYYEFVERDAPKTMSTMVNVPYVNHVATLTGGMGYDDLARFYKYHFTKVSPPDTELITISRTVGADRIIDEMIFKATHTTEIEYFLPGVRPTGKPLEIAMVGVVAFRGDKLTFEHLYWDQASTLVQLGLLDRTSLPIAGVEVAQKVMNPFGVPSNTLLTRWKESEGLSID
ncbi:NTF2-like protein [Artomyces pyxidatus]|uniref:NTF2-like protein n=1 Tax=Artomyces pyxidatus TaxID=48021 RepID=A0ACB8TJ14_9AGAM|nr:NTF2-like protein [Artomyces pyxidatus]